MCSEVKFSFFFANFWVFWPAEVTFHNTI